MAAAPMVELIQFIYYVLQLYIYILVAAALLSWLVAFNVVNPRHPFVAAVGQVLFAVTEPILRPIRNLMPRMGPVDISPVVVILIIIFIQSVVLPNILKLFL
jgi:YggT family protein